MARSGNTRFAQAYAKNWGRKMKVNAKTEQQLESRGQFLENFKGVYSIIGQHEEQQQMSSIVQPQQQQQMMIQKPQKKQKAAKPKKMIRAKNINNEMDGHMSDSESESDCE